MVVAEMDRDAAVVAAGHRCIELCFLEHSCCLRVVRTASAVRPGCGLLPGSHIAGRGGPGALKEGFLAVSRRPGRHLAAYSSVAMRLGIPPSSALRPEMAAAFRTMSRRYARAARYGPLGLPAW